jgi:hypothetical protein
VQKTDGDDRLKYSASVRLNDDRSARIAALQAELEARDAGDGTPTPPRKRSCRTPPRGFTSIR